MTIIQGDLLHSGTNTEENRFLVVEGSKLQQIAATWKEKVHSRYPVITPAFIDAHAHIGMIRTGEPRSEGEANEHMTPFLANADALDSVQMDDLAFRDSVESGVLYSCVVPGSGNIIGGKTAIIRNYAGNSTSALIARAGIKTAIGHNPIATTNWKGERPFTRMGTMALLREKLYQAKERMRKQIGDIPSQEELILRNILKGRERMRVHAHKTDDIAALLRIVDEFHLDITVEHAKDVYDPEVFRELKKRRIPVVYGPLDSLAYKTELKHDSWRNIRHLIDSGVQFGLMTDHPVTLQKTLHLGLRWFLRCGLDKNQALAIITKNNAEILGIGRELGTLEAGKWASFICWNGDPFDLTSYPVAIYAEGKQIYSEQSSP